LGDKSSLYDSSVPSGQHQQEFGGKPILFVGDLLQLRPVVSHFSMPVVYQLIARLSYWPTIRKVQLKRPMRALEPLRAGFSLSIAKGQTHDIQDWRKLQTRFRVTVAQNIETAQSFFCLGLEPRDSFPLDRQYICATNKPMNQINHHFQQSGSQKGSVVRGRVCLYSTYQTFIQLPRIV
jgi:hypothetical protein